MKRGGTGHLTQDDREAFEKSQFMSIQKAINQQEIAAKEKHVRTAILGTYQEKGASIFWHVVMRLQLSTHTITCWKFCHVLHKLLRDGHERTLRDSLAFKSQIKDLGNIWVHAGQTYGGIIPKYCKYLVRRMEFADRYKEFSGNLSISDSALDGIGNNDINSYFELCVDIMDCLEYLMDLQEGIFKTLDFSKAVSMTGPGQCRLAPCIPIILDSSQFYDYSLRLMFKLHGCLPSETLSGHRERFSVLFNKLKRFFYQCSNMLYFKKLIQIPLLPDEPPNFLIKSEEHHQLGPAVMIEEDGPVMEREPSPEPLIVPQDVEANFDAIFGSLQRMNDFSFHNEPDPRDGIIQELREEIERLKRQIENMTQEHVIEIRRLLDRINELERELALSKDADDANKAEVQNLKRELILANGQIEKASKRQTVLDEVERKSLANEELYKKMKERYMNLVKDHAELLRKNTDVQKRNEGLQQSAKDFSDRQNQLQEDYEKLHQTIAGKENDLRLAMKNKQDETRRDFEVAVAAAESMIKEAIEDINNPLNAQSTCSAASLIHTVNTAMQSLDNLHLSANEFFQDSDQKTVIKALAAFGHSIAQALLNGSATCHLVSDENGSDLRAACDTCGNESLNYLTELRKNSAEKGCEISIDEVQRILQKMLTAASDLLPKMKDIAGGDLQDIVDQEMSSTTNAIESAAARIEEMLQQARERDSGINLEVNERILDSCTELMLAIKALIISSKELQREIVDEGRGASSIKEFYMKNSRWTEGLISAAKAVGFGATLLTDAAHQAVTSDGKFEEIIVCSHEIAASTAQLVAASRVKARKLSPKLPKLQKASKDVNAAAGRVVASANSGRKQMDENTDLLASDLSKFTLTQIKRKEMDSQVRLLELEQALQQERVKLGKLRKQHYVLAGVEDDDENDSKEDRIGTKNTNNSSNTNDVNTTVNTDTEFENPTPREKPPLPIKPSWT